MSKSQIQNNIKYKSIKSLPNLELIKELVKVLEEKFQHTDRVFIFNLPNHLKDLFKENFGNYVEKSTFEAWVQRYLSGEANPPKDDTGDGEGTTSSEHWSVENQPTRKVGFPKKDNTTDQFNSGRNWSTGLENGRNWSEINFDTFVSIVKRIVPSMYPRQILPIYVLYHRGRMSKSTLRAECERVNQALDLRYSTTSIKNSVNELAKNHLLINKHIIDGEEFLELSSSLLSDINFYLKELEAKKEEEKQKTEIDREDMIYRFAKFFREYVVDGVPIYIEQLKDLLAMKPKKSFEVDWEHLNAFDPQLAHMLITSDWPESVIASAEDALMLIQKEPPILMDEPRSFHVRFYNLPMMLIPREAVEPEYINRLIQVRGIVSRAVETKLFVQRAVFVCKDCGNEMVRLQRPHENMVVPPKCDACGSRNVELDVRKSRFTKYQVIRVQDEPETMSGVAYQPRHVDVILLDDLVETVTPGDRVVITGTMEVIAEKNGKRPIFKRLLIANHVLKLNKRPDEEELTEADEAKIRELAKSEKNLKKKIINSIAPSIMGMEEVKEFIALALFGGVSKILPDGTRVRGESHILLVGDPGKAKSHLLEFIARIMPRAIYTDGAGGTTGVGLTAAAKRDDLTGEWVLEAGVLPLADGGYALIDEFEKMSSDDREHIHVAMSRGYITISKAGIHATLNTRTTVIAAANPKYGKWNENLAPADQIDLPPTIFDRFDAILVIRDIPDEEEDRRLANFILERKSMSEAEMMKGTIPPELLRKYVLYARKYIEPRLSKEAKEILADYYVKIRQKAKKVEGFLRVPLSARQLEAVLRLAEAHARMHLRDEITVEDAKRAIELHNWAIRQLLPEISGEFDLLVGGRPLSEYVIMRIMEEVVKELDDGEVGAPHEAVVQEALDRLKQKGYNISKRQVEAILNALVNEGKISRYGSGFYRLVSSPPRRTGVQTN